MAPPRKPINSKKDKWHLAAYSPEEDYVIKYEVTVGKDVIRVGDPIKIKYSRSQYLFRCLVHHIPTDTTWFDCLDEDGFHSFRLVMLMGPKKKRSRRRKNNE